MKTLKHIFVSLALSALAVAFVGHARAQVSNGRVTTAAPTYTNGATSPFSLDTAGNLRVSGSFSGALPAGNNNIGGVFVTDSAGTNRASVSAAGAVKVDGSAATQPISGTVTANQGGAPWSTTISGTPAVTISGTVAATQSGTFTVQPGNTANTTAWLVQSVAGTTGGATNTKVISAATTNSTLIKASAGVVYHIAAYAVGATPAYLKLYNKATAPTCGTDTPIATFAIPGGANASGNNVPLHVGIAFTTGIGICITGGITDADTTATAANAFVANIGFK